MRKFLSMLLIAATLFTMVSAGIAQSSATGDPADSYVPITAPYEDSAIQMWFEHSNVKVHQEDTVSTGKDTYSIYMAKNEIQGAQVVLYSPEETKANLKAELTTFTAMDGSGNEIESELYFEFYIETESLNVLDVLGVDRAEDSIIRDGAIPDPIAPADGVNYRKGEGGRFTLTAGKTQAFITRLKTTTETAPGWYSGTFNLLNSDNQIVKTATVYAYVWDFEIPEKLSYETSIYIDATQYTEDMYKEWYDYLLENRLLGMNVPGELNSSNPYISNPRVAVFRIADKSSYLGGLSTAQIKAVHDDLSQMENWDEIKEKAYFYLTDEPTSQEQADALAAANPEKPRHTTVTDVINRYITASNAWDPENTYYTVPFHENHPYPYYTYSNDLALKDGVYLTADDGSGRFDGAKDATQGMFDADAVTLWCPKMNAFTPPEYLTDYVGTNEAATKVRNLNGIVSGFNILNTSACYFDWDSIFGTFAERFKAYQTEKAAEGKNIKLWWYASGNNSHYTYCNHLIENTGLQTELMFWQSMQVGSTGYLYYGSNQWDNEAKTVTNGSSNKFDGSLGGSWKVNEMTRGAQNEYNIYGNGVLFYGTDAVGTARLRGQKYVGSIRVENMRDGVEDYEMLNLYRQYFGEEKMQEMISKVSKDIVCYLSLPGFDRSSWDSELTSEDIFAKVRIELGNAIEKQVSEGPVDTNLYGDVNGDGKINTVDLRCLKAAIAAVDGVSINETLADINKDDEVNTQDLLELQKILAK